MAPAMMGFSMPVFALVPVFLVFFLSLALAPFSALARYHHNGRRGRDQKRRDQKWRDRRSRGFRQTGVAGNGKQEQ